MTVFWIVVAITVIAFILLSPRIWPRLFGAYCRYNPVLDGQLAFWTRDGAENYGTRGLGGIDPYARHLSPHVTFRPGLILRRDDKVSP